MAALAGPAMAFPCDGTFVDSHARYHHHHDDHDDTNLDHQTDDDDAKDATSKSMLSFVSPVLQPVEQRARQLLLLRLLQEQEEEEEEQVAGVGVMVESKGAGAGKDAGAAAAFASIWDKLLRVMTARASPTSTKMTMTLRDQLQALQSVQRCLRDRNHNRNNKKISTTEDEEHAPDTTNTTAAAVYWLLLEAAIANGTPTCLSRALFSTLETLWWFLSVPPHITATTTTTAENDSLPPPQQLQILQHIHRYVWESVCQVTTSNSTATTTTIPSVSLSSPNDWKDPIRSLKLLITYPPMISQLQLVVSSSQSCWSLLLHHARTLQPILVVTTRTTADSTSLEDTEEEEDRAPLQDEPSAKSDHWNQLSVTSAVQSALELIQLAKQLVVLLFLQQPQQDDRENQETSLLSSHSHEVTVSTIAALDALSQFTWSLFTSCPILPVDSLSGLGVAYARLYLTAASSFSSSGAATRPMLMHTAPSGVQNLAKVLQRVHHDLPELRAVAVLQGFAATMDNAVLFSRRIIPMEETDTDHSNGSSKAPSSSSPPSQQKPVVLLQELLNSFQRLAAGSVQTEVRLMALKGMRALVSRCVTVWKDHRRGNAQERKPNAVTIAETTKPAVTQTTTTTATFHNHRPATNGGMSGHDDSNNDEEEACLTRTMHAVAQTVLPVVLQEWDDPPTRKHGHCVHALFAVLVDLLHQLEHYEKPIGGGNQPANSEDCSVTSPLETLVGRILSQPANRKGRYLALDTLLPEIGARGLLQMSSGGGGSSPAATTTRLLEDLIQGIGDFGHNTVAIADLWAKLLRKLWQEMKEGDEVSSGRNDDDLPARPDWETSLFRQWLDLWVPSLATNLCSNELRRRKQVSAFCLARIKVVVGDHGNVKACAAASFCDLMHRISESERSSEFCPSVAILSSHRETPEDRVLWAQLEVTRMALQLGVLKLDDTCSATISLRDAIDCTVTSGRLQTALLHSSVAIRSVAFPAIEGVVQVRTLAQMDKIKAESAFWMLSLPFAIKTSGKEYVTTVLYSLLSFLDRASMIEAGLNTDSADDDQNNYPLPFLCSFVIDFLLRDILVKKAAYPGSVVDKQAFALSLIECIAVFTSRDHSLALASTLLPKTGAIFQRGRLSVEEVASSEIRREIFSVDTIACLLGLLHSSWDQIRAEAYQMLSALLMVRARIGIELPSEYETESAVQGRQEHALFLASSPRQREADTGARWLAFLYLSLTSSDRKIAFFANLTDLLEHRVALMKEKLVVILQGKAGQNDGRGLPLAHGLIQGLRMILESEDLPSTIIQNGLMKRTVEIFCSAIRLSLTVVADMRDGVKLEGLDEDIALASTYDEISGGKNVQINPGAIGANGIFSSVHRLTEDEHQRRLASQRIVIGSWLLTKETCTALSVAFSVNGFIAENSQIHEAGMILLSTLTSLKHTGAAFAAHKSIQQIANCCLKSNVSSIQLEPASWLKRLVDEISEAERVRDSTLRRSTGYALGFLSLMRSEVVSRGSPRILCRQIMMTLVGLSLPPKSHLERFMSCIGSNAKSILAIFSETEHVRLVGDDEYETRTRVHALNALRAIVLDAPLSHEVLPFGGDLISAAIIGYVDQKWSVRNSSTMLFASCMLRVIDADKNASKSSSASSKAATFPELFRSYPRLRTFLILVLRGSVEGRLTAWKGALPPRLPVLLLLSRVQPSSYSGDEAATLVQPFVSLVKQSFGHRDLAVRNVAARALTSLTTGKSDGPFSARSLVHYSLNVVTAASSHWNEVHGALLAIKELLKSHYTVKLKDNERITVELLHRMLPTCANRLNAPPLCTATALEILSLLQINSNHSDDALCEKCWLVTSWVQKNSYGPFAVPCSAFLGSTAATLLCQRLCYRLRNDSDGSEAYKNYLALLSALFRSSCLDVRAAAIKVFKKSMADGIYFIEIGLNDQNSCRDDRILELIDMLVAILSLELDRNRNSHPPTMRRLSRCIVECIANADAFDDILSDSLKDRVWAVSMALIDFSQEKNGEGAETALRGNALEMMSFVLRDDRFREVDRAQTFLSHVAALSYPSLSWRLRHSAAASILFSRALSWDFDAQLGCGFRQATCSAASRLLQDADSDVRSAISFAVERSGKIASAPELVMQAGYGVNGLLAPESGDRLFNNLLVATDDLVGTAMMIAQEFDSIAFESSECDDINVQSTRNIFEEENPNSYVEQTLEWQISLNFLVTSKIPLQENEIALCQQLFDRANQILEVLQDRRPATSQTSKAMKITSDKKIMPILHSLLLGCACAIFLGARDATAAQALAKSTVSSGFLHPLIDEALSVFARAHENNDQTQQSLLHSCFLIPRFRSTEP